MKKLSLILALIFVLTCSVFVACGEETETSSEAAAESSAAESKAESVATSEAESEAESETVSEAESVATSEAESEAESTPEAESSEPAGEVEVTGTNVAKGLKPTISGTGVGHGNYTADLTDGNAATAMAYDGTWFAFYNNAEADQATVNAPDFVGTAIFDLGAAKNITTVRANCVNNIGSGVPAPKSIKVYLSADGENWTEAGSLPVQSIENTAYWAEANIEGNAQYVKIAFELDGVFAFVNEIEIYA